MSSLPVPFVFEFEKLLWYRITTLLASPIGPQLPFLESYWFIASSFYKEFQPIKKDFPTFCMHHGAYVSTSSISYICVICFSFKQLFSLRFAQRLQRQACTKRDSCYCYGNISSHFQASQSWKSKAEWTV